MIEIKHNRDCCGCEACVQVCPKSCITFSEYRQGFLYPTVDKDTCVDCGLCEIVCPIINKSLPSQISHRKVYAVKSKNDIVREQSSSGGFFSILADYVLHRDGVVYGAAFDESLIVRHIRVDDIHKLSRLRGSKYVQSRIELVFRECKKDLLEGKLVLFTGTPCQISALGKFLTKEYNNLIKVEIVCHGVPSPVIFQQYIKETLDCNNNDVKIHKVNFRTKLDSWKNYFFTIEYDQYSELKVYQECVSDSLYLKGFLNNLSIRPSCFDCPAKDFTSGADFTIADFWGQEFTFPDFDNDKGVSAVFTNTDKAKDLFVELNSYMIVLEKSYSDFVNYNPSLVASPEISSSYGKFWNLYSKTGRVRSSIIMALKVSFTVRIINKIKNILK